MSDTPPPFDIDVFAGVMAAYMRYSVAQQDRHTAAGEEPPVVEGNAHNEFLRRRALYPGLFRHVAKAMDIPLYHRRIEAITAAAVASALKDKPTLKDWANAMGKPRVDATTARFQHRVAKEYVPDAIRVQDDPALDDQRMRAIETTFSPLPGYSLKDLSGPGSDVQQWKAAPQAKFTDANDWLTVSAALMAAWPEQLHVWLLVQRAVNRAIKDEPRSDARDTIAHPLVTSVMANHAASVCANSWWMGREAAVHMDLLRTPRVFDLTEADAESAARLWHDLVATHPEWAQVAPLMLQDTGLALKRWGALAPAAVFLRGISALPGMKAQPRAAAWSNAGTMFRDAGRPNDAVPCYRTALPLMDALKDPYQGVVARVNLAEVLGGPKASREAADLLAQALRRASDDRCRAAFWRNAGTMFHRLKDDEREEAALDALLPLLTAGPPETSWSARTRWTELQRSRRLKRPMESIASIQYP